MGTYIPRERETKPRRINVIENNLILFAENQGWSLEATCLRNYFTGKTLVIGISEGEKFDAIKSRAKETGVNLWLKARL